MASADTLICTPETRLIHPEPLHSVLGYTATLLAEVDRNASDTRQTAWQNTQGVEPEGELRANLPYYAEVLQDNPLYNQRPEVIRLFEQFNLTQLSRESIEHMTQEDRKELADRFVTTVGSKYPAVLIAEGCDYWNRGFDTEADAHNFGVYLKGLHDVIRAQPFYKDLEQTVEHNGGIDSARRRVANHDKQQRMIVVFDAKKAILRTHFEPVGLRVVKKQAAA